MKKTKFIRKKNSRPWVYFFYLLCFICLLSVVVELSGCWTSSTAGSVSTTVVQNSPAEVTVNVTSNNMTFSSMSANIQNLSNVSIVNASSTCESINLANPLYAGNSCNTKS